MVWSEYWNLAELRRLTLPVQLLAEYRGYLTDFPAGKNVVSAHRWRKNKFSNFSDAERSTCSWKSRR